MHTHVDAQNNLVLDAWELVAAAPTSVGTTTVQAEISTFAAMLLMTEVATANGHNFELAAGTASFNLYALVDGRGDAVIAENSTKIQFYRVGSGVGQCDHPTGCLVSRPFTIRYLDASDDVWELDVGSGYWAEP
jgi:hypothetical protein